MVRDDRAQGKQSPAAGTSKKVDAAIAQLWASTNFYFQCFVRCAADADPWSIPHVVRTEDAHVVRRGGHDAETEEPRKRGAQG